ncbi:MAG: hypothetical protein MZV65_17830 [Chromatiales bacterium]|nr:hypothetical protein [Chromatiales bacterium]
MSMLTTLNLLWFAARLGARTAARRPTCIGRWSTSTEENRGLAMNRFLQFQGVGLGAVRWPARWCWPGATPTPPAGAGASTLLDLARHSAPRAGSSPIAFFLLFYGLAVRTPLFPAARLAAGRVHAPRHGGGGAGRCCWGSRWASTACCASCCR